MPDITLALSVLFKKEFELLDILTHYFSTLCALKILNRNFVNK